MNPILVGWLVLRPRTSTFTVLALLRVECNAPGRRAHFHVRCKNMRAEVLGHSHASVNEATLPPPRKARVRPCAYGIGVLLGSQVKGAHCAVVFQQAVRHTHPRPLPVLWPLRSRAFDALAESSVARLAWLTLNPGRSSECARSSQGAW